MTVVHTDNERSVRDTEGGREQRVAMTHGVVAAVNLHIASQSAITVGLGMSMWTLLMQIMHQDERRPVGMEHDTHARCRGSREHIIIDAWHPWVTERNTPVAVRDALSAVQASGRGWWCRPGRPPRSPPPPPAPPARPESESDDMRLALLNKYY